MKGSGSFQKMGNALLPKKTLKLRGFPLGRLHIHWEKK